MLQIQNAVIVSGLPASGKTTLAKSIAAELGFPHLDKDDFLEAIYNNETIETVEDRNKLSRLADEQFRIQAVATTSVVLSSWWNHPLSKSESGTPIGWLIESEIKFVEVFCLCPAKLAAERFRARFRHPGHLDHLRSSDALLSQLEEAESLGPLVPSKAIVCNTSRHVSPAQVTQLTDRIRTFFAPE